MLVSARVAVINTTVHHCGYSGVCAEHESAISLKGCSLQFNGQTGVVFSKSWGAIEDCKMNDNNFNGIALQSGATATVTSCTMHANAMCGVCVIDKYSHAALTKCHITNNQRYGVAAIRGKCNVVDCEIEGNKLGTGLEQSCGKVVIS